MDSFYSVNLDTKMYANSEYAIEEATALAKFTDDTVSFTFNGVNIRVEPRSDPVDIYVKYRRRITNG